MGRFCIVMALVVLGCAAAHAQSGISPSALPGTSPFGTLGSDIAGGLSAGGIPPGATEIDPGGLSPAAGSTCGATGTGISGSMVTSGTTFDGGGVAGVGSGSTDACTASSAASGGSPSSLAVPVAGGSAFSLNGGDIPLGSTEMDEGGLSGILSVPAPSITSCEAATTGSTASSPASSSGC
jgi:hypothetical protein